LKADLGNSALTAATISPLVAKLFASIVSMTTCLIVRFASASDFSTLAAGVAYLIGHSLMQTVLPCSQHVGANSCLSRRRRLTFMNVPDIIALVSACAFVSSLML
jgi:hypothetical protein